MELFKSQITKLKSKIVSYLLFGAWNLFNSRTLLDLITQFYFFNILVGHDTIRYLKMYSQLNIQKENWQSRRR
jgi:hypothetical protein